MDKIVQFFNVLSQVDRVEWVLLVATLLFGYMLRHAQVAKDSFDLRDVLIDETTGKVSLYKLGQLISLLLSSWGFVYLTIHDKLSESYFGLYMATWAGAHVLSQGLSVWSNKDTPGIASAGAASVQQPQQPQPQQPPVFIPPPMRGPGG